MSLIVSSATAALQTAPSTNNAGNNANAQQADADHFGKMLNRSLTASDKSAENAASSAKPTDRAAAHRQANGSANADNDSEHQQDPAAAPALAFLALPQVAAKAIEANPQSGSESQPQSAAEIQLNAAIAAAGGRSGTPTVATAPVAETPDKSTSLIEATPSSASQLAARASPAGATPSKQSALANQEPGSGEYTPLAHSSPQLINQIAAGDAAGQQAAHDDGKHDKLEKSGHPDSQTVAKVDAGKTDVAAGANANLNGVTAAKAAAGNSGQPNLDMTAQMNPAITHTQTTAAAASSVLPPPVKLALSPVVGSDGWGTALGKQVIWMGNTNNQSAELHLNPPDLGPLKVTLTINDNQAQAMFVSAHQSVRSALEAALPQLRNSLAESGISLGNTSVSADAQQPQQQQQSAFAQNQSGQRGSNNQFQSGTTVNEPGGNLERSAAPVSRNGNGKVDIFA